jgi:hypothetical protein
MRLRWYLEGSPVAEGKVHIQDCDIASSVRRVGLAGVPGRDSPFSYLRYVKCAGAVLNGIGLGVAALQIELLEPTDRLMKHVQVLPTDDIGT